MRKRILVVPAVSLIVVAVVLIGFLGSKPTGVPEEVEVVAQGLVVPWAMDFAPDGTLFFTERPGRVSMIRDGEVFEIYSLDASTSLGAESGLLGIALHPEFESNQLIYIFYTYSEDSRKWNRVSRLVLRENRLVDEEVILDRIPGGNIHDGGRLKFGPDRKLYVTTGETGRGELAQDLDSLSGKILRMNPDGSVPRDNPFEGSLVYSYGHRNPQGLAWHPVAGDLYSTEHGPSGEGLKFAHDEINKIVPGGNYGWPQIVGDGDSEEYVDPVYHTGDVTWAPSGITFLDSPSSVWHLKLFIATLRGGHLRVVTLAPPDYTEVESTTALYQGELGRLRDVVQGPDGYLYVCTSNRDGRGSPGEEDDLIVRVRPPTGT